MKNKTLRGFVNDIKTIYEKHEMINDFGFGFVEDVTFKKQHEGAVQYPYLFVIPDNTSVDERELQYTLRLIMMDRVINYTDENLLDVMSDMNQTLQDVVAQFKMSYTAEDGDYTDIYEITTPVTLEPFADKFDDYVCGYFCTITVTLPQPIDRCDAPYEPFN